MFSCLRVFESKVNAHAAQTAIYTTLSTSPLSVQWPLLQREALVVTGSGNSAFQLPVQTWLQWTQVQNELNSACNHPVKSVQS